jgi:hypothetical protein
MSEFYLEENNITVFGYATDEDGRIMFYLAVRDTSGVTLGNDYLLGLMHQAKKHNPALQYIDNWSWLHPGLTHEKLSEHSILLL